MARIPATEFKAKCLQLMDRVAERRETYVITKRGKPVARLVPVERRPEESLFGRLRGMAEETGDIMSPVLPADAWETLKEWDELERLGPARGTKASKKPRRRRPVGR